GVFNVFGNTFSIDETDRDAFRERSRYVDIHTLDNTDGELRGQLLPLATSYFHTSLNGWNEVQPVATTGVGGLKLELTDNVLTVSGAFTDLTSDFDANIGAHLHLGNAGENGGVTLPLIVENPTDLRNGIVPSLENFFELTDEQIAALRNGELYANFHSTDFPMGELRGQIVAEINDFPSRGTTINTPANGSTITIDGAPSTPFRASWQMARDRDNLAYIWQLSTDAQFSDLLANQNVGTTLEFVTDFATVDAILENAGIEAGESVMLFHRAVATDGSNYTTGPTSVVTLERGSVVNTVNPILEQFDVQVFPTLTTANSRINVQVNATEHGTGRLTLINQLGQVVDYQEIELINGANDYQLQLANLAAGAYFVQLEIAEVALPLEKVIVQ
ncbi:MAG: CHRD domain-containing protein, partial [Saprospiraceae bacterium]